jgi:hypothetical protein
VKALSSLHVYPVEPTGVVPALNAKSGAKSRQRPFGFFRLVPGVVTLRRHQKEKAGAHAGLL